MNLRNPKEYCESLLVIRNKKQELVPLRFNEAQSNLYAVIRQQAALGKPIRIIILKGRQEGISTVTEALMFQDTVTRPNVKTLIVAHDSGATGNLFKMNKLFYDCLPRRMQPMRKNSNAKELVFENPTREPKEKAKRPGLRSSIRCQTAGSGSVGRSDTLTNVHISEYAFWPKDKKDLLLGIMQTVPNDPSTMVVIESTANGYDHFKELWDGAENGTNEWIPVFLPWYLEKGYRMAVPPGTEWTEEERQLQRDFGLDEEQLQWRRWCIRANCGGSVEVLISSIGTVKPVMPPTEAAAAKTRLQRARTAYNALTASQKALVPNYASLQEGETAYRTYESNYAAAKAAESLISAIGTVTADSGDAIRKAQEAYDALTAEQKQLVDARLVQQMETAAAQYRQLLAQSAENGGETPSADETMSDGVKPADRMQPTDQTRPEQAQPFDWSLVWLGGGILASAAAIALILRWLAAVRRTEKKNKA